MSDLLIGLLLGFGGAAVATALYGNSLNAKASNATQEHVFELEDTVAQHTKQIEWAIDLLTELTDCEGDEPPPGDEDDDETPIETDATAKNSVKASSGPIPFRPKKVS